MNNYFKKAGNIDATEHNDFTLGGDLETPKQNYFAPGGDLEIQESKPSLIEAEIKDYLLTIVSGKKYDYGNESQTLLDGGRIIVTFNQLKEMVNKGYNIVNAKYINQNMIEIEFEYHQQMDTRKGKN